MTNCLVVIPAYNEGDRIYQTVSSVLKDFLSVVIVNDASIDNTLEAVSSCKVTVLNHMTNLGQGAAILTGIKYFLRFTSLEYVATFDADGQHLSSDCKRLYKYASSRKLDAVFGSRFTSANDYTDISKSRKLFLGAANLFERIVFKSYLQDSHNGMRVLSRKSAQQLLKMDSMKMAHASEVFMKLNLSGIAVHEMPVDVRYDVSKPSSHYVTALNIVSDLWQRK